MEVVVAQRKQKILAFLPTAVVVKFEGLSRRSGLSKSELYRTAIEKGLAATESWVERTYPPLAERAEQGGAAPSSGHPLGALGEYADALSSQIPDATEDAFRSMLVAQARVLAISPAMVDSVVEGAVRGRFAVPAGPAVSGDIAGVPDLD